MAAMSDKQLTELGIFLEGAKARDVLVLDVHETCSWADTFILATYNSQGHLKGLVHELEDWADQHWGGPPRRSKKKQVNEWMLVDWDDVVIHLFSETARTYYELEKLWFNARTIYSSKS